MKRMREIVSGLNVKDIRFMPGEHDEALDKGEAFKEFFGDTHYTFDHKGVHFIALDNVSDPVAELGDEQLAWLAADLKQRKPDDRIVVLTYRPLFELQPSWDWATADGAKANRYRARRENAADHYANQTRQLRLLLRYLLR